MGKFSSMCFYRKYIYTHQFEKWLSSVWKPTTFAFQQFQLTTAFFAFINRCSHFRFFLAWLLLLPTHTFTHAVFLCASISNVVDSIETVPNESKKKMYSIQVALNDSVKWVFTRFAWLQSHYKKSHSSALSFTYKISRNFRFILTLWMLRWWCRCWIKVVSL